eukprot:m.255872 g.255872  ORF g.255872 m.255872 type:complete len:51 (-) comp20398_c0_seq1:37-189(-)
MHNKNNSLKQQRRTETRNATATTSTIEVTANNFTTPEPPVNNFLHKEQLT